MMQLAKDILNKAIVVRKSTSTSCYSGLITPNDIVLVSISLQERKKYKKESLINENI